MRSLLLGFWFLAASGEVPTFDQFKVTDKFTGKSATPILQTRMQKTFRTMIRDAAQAGPNFAGHYALAQWGCGAGCVSMAVVDCKTGKTVDGPFNLLGFDLSNLYEGGEEQLDFRPDSRLIIARGCPGEKDCGTYYYEWTNDHFKLLRKTPATKKP